VRIAQVHGANGTAASDAGDVLAYSAAHGDVDGDGRDDIVTNEMMGNGTTVEAVDVGNLIAINGTLIAGSDGPPSCASEPSPVCRQVGEGASFLRLARGVTQLDDRLNWSWESGQSEDVTVFHDPLGTIAASYRICVYSASDPERAISQGVVPSGGQCAGTQCWKPIGGDGYVFVDPSAGRDGVRRIKLRTRDGVGTFIRLRARGPLWRAANLPLALPVTVRFFVASAGQYECWEAAYSSAAANEPDVFRSRRGTPGLDRAEPGR
jgi:hypothetical protein